MQIPNPVQESVWLEVALMDFRQDARPHSDEEVSKLAGSMATRQLQSILVCRNGSRYEVIAGVGRILSARKLNWEKIRTDVYEGLNELHKLSMMFDENEDRENAPALYQAKLLKEMMSAENLNQEQLAGKTGKDKTTISKYMSLFDLSPKIWGELNRFNSLGIKHFMQLLRIENADDQFKFAEIAVDKDLSVDALQALIDKQLGVKSGAKKVGRPKGDKSLDANGFAFTRKGSKLRIKAEFDEASGVDAFLANLKGALASWQGSHPQKTTTPTSKATSDTAVQEQPREAVTA